MLGLACAVERGEIDLTDDPARYVAEVEYRRGVLERDLWFTDNAYARTRLALYGVDGSGWEVLPERSPASRPYRPGDVGAAWSVDDPELTILTAEPMPTTDAEWRTLGERVFFDHPLHADPGLTALSAEELRAVGFYEDDGAFLGLRLFVEDGSVRLGPTCAQCHVSPDPELSWSARLPNRGMDIGRLRLLVMGVDPTDPPEGLDTTDIEHLALLGPGRADVLADAVFNPYAFPGFAGYRDLPYLHHTANWLHSGTATLAVRCETLFITSNHERTRIPRVFAWAVAHYLRDLGALPPLTVLTEEEEAEGERVFQAADCDRCHEPPLFTSSRRVTVEQVGTDPLAGESDARGTGLYRIPSLRGVGHVAPYLHHGAFPDLESMFDPQRTEPGHRYGLELTDEDRAILLRYLRSL